MQYIYFLSHQHFIFNTQTLSQGPQKAQSIRDNSLAQEAHEVPTALRNFNRYQTCAAPYNHLTPL